MAKRTAKTKRAPAKPEPTPWEKLLTAHQSLENAESERPGRLHEWLSPKQAYWVLDRGIDETMEDMLADLRSAPGLHLFPSLPDLTATAHLLFAELRGRMRDKLSLRSADVALQERDER
ncbi:MAG: hypothetical protein M3T56_03240 [Chloroflexota bacterium]|nr:hypothetical protein [Chloroflexota bacterium]